jgi:crotonobetainyl-CoA:carnitine CoA-transferase CaiB-like acyl-CoA transferase
MGIQNLEKDTRFDTVESRSKNAPELINIFDQLFSSRPRDEWVSLLKDGGCICTPIQSPMEVSKDPQAIANNYVLNIEHPEIGKTKILGFPWDFHSTPAEYRRAAPKLGEHADEILREAGYNAQAIVKLRNDGVVI